MGTRDFPVSSAPRKSLTWQETTNPKMTRAFCWTQKSRPVATWPVRITASVVTAAARVLTRSQGAVQLRHFSTASVRPTSPERTAKMKANSTMAAGKRHPLRRRCRVPTIKSNARVVSASVTRSCASATTPARRDNWPRFLPVPIASTPSTTCV